MLCHFLYELKIKSEGIYKMKALYRPLYNALTAGETLLSLNQTIQKLRLQNLYPIADYIKESATTEKDVQRTTDEYMKLVNVRDLDYVALKPSSFRFQEKPMERLIEEFIRNNKRVLIDAENVAHQDKIQTLTDAFIEAYNTDNVWIYKTYQMYRRDSLDTLTRDLERFPNHGVKLVRGAYWNQDRATGALFLQKSDTDTAFRAALKQCLSRTNYSMFHAMICTHNSDDIQCMIDTPKRHICHASLYGFIPSDTQKLVKAGISSYKYLPYGAMEDAIPYLIRRIQENPYILQYLFH